MNRVHFWHWSKCLLIIDAIRLSEFVAVNRILYYLIVSSAFCFTVNTSLHPTAFFPIGRGTNSNVFFLSTALIFSSIACFRSTMWYKQGRQRRNKSKIGMRERLVIDQFLNRTFVRAPTPLHTTMERLVLLIILSMIMAKTRLEPLVEGGLEIGSKDCNW